MFLVLLALEMFSYMYYILIMKSYMTVKYCDNWMLNENFSF